VSSRRATTPVPRVRYQSSLALPAAAITWATATVAVVPRAGTCPHRGATGRSRAPGDGHGRGGGWCRSRRSRRRLGRRVGSLGDRDERWCGCEDGPSSPAVRREPERRNRSPWMRRACRERGERRAERETARGDQRGCSANAVDCCIASSDRAAELGGTRRHGHMVASGNETLVSLSRSCCESAATRPGS
jgi:hypothetical protein